MKRVILGLLLLLVVTSRAANADSGVTVSPPFQDLQLTKQQAKTEFVYTVTNNDQKLTKTMALTAVDFGSLDESGGIAFLGSKPDSPADKHGLAKWITFAPAQLILSPGQKTDVKVSVTNSDALKPGGHYGAIMLNLISEQGTGAPQNVTVKPIVSTLIFLSKLGGEKYGLRLASVQHDSTWWESLNLQLRFENTGNIHVVPRGVVYLRDPFGREVARGDINEASVRILPGTFRVMGVDLIRTHKFSLPGFYKVVVNYRYDGQPNFATYSAKAFYIDPKTALGIALVLLIVTAAIFALVWIFRKSRIR